jgi:hypothetical protein
MLFLSEMEPVMPAMLHDKKTFQAIEYKFDVDPQDRSTELECVFNISMYKLGCAPSLRFDSDSRHGLKPIKELDSHFFSFLQKKLLEAYGNKKIIEGICVEHLGFTLTLSNKKLVKHEILPDSIVSTIKKAVKEFGEDG